MLRERRHKNIPIFIPHLGCPHQCVFCDQIAISGHSPFRTEAVREEISAALATLEPGDEAEIAFFGGSFTAIPRKLMCELLQMAEEAVQDGQVKGIRFSTRPDAVSEDVLDCLERYSVSAIELGIQSMNDRVLNLARRGHTAADATDACRRIRRRGWPLVGQMMVGLPGSSANDECETARQLGEMGCTAARVYPLVVFDGTALADEWRAGRYCPPDNTEAAERCADVLEVLEKNRVMCLRVGLCASETLSSARALAGANHPALGEMAYGVLFLRQMMRLLSGQSVCGKRVSLTVPPARLSQAVGQGRCNIKKMCAGTGAAEIRIRTDGNLPDGIVVRLTEIS